MAKGQCAMAVAMIHPEPEKGGRGKKGDKDYQVSRQYVSHARTVLRSSPDLAAEVLAGSMSLDAAYQTVQQQTGQIRNARNRLAKLRDERPDLADQSAQLAAPRNRKLRGLSQVSASH